MKSLRSRQLISAFGIIMIGIVILGALLFYFSFEKKIDEKYVQLEDYNFSLLGFFNMSKRQGFYVEKAQEKDLVKFLKENNFNDVFSGRGGTLADTFAYAQDISTKEIIWHSKYPKASSNILSSGVYQQAISFFDIPTPPNQKHDIRKYELDPLYLIDGKKKYEPDNKYLVVARSVQQLNRGQFQLVVATSTQSIQHEKDSFLGILTILFFVSIVLVLIAQMSLSFWIIDPIKDFENEIVALGRDENKQEVIGDYPEELIPIKNAVNDLLNNEKGQKQRYKDKLDDLAHSLKTPLTGINGYIDLVEVYNKDFMYGKEIKEQLQRMNDIITYHLTSAVVTERQAIIPPQLILPLLKRLRTSLLKVYIDKGFEIKFNVGEHDQCRLQYDDLMELIANLLNNACRFCNKLIEISTKLDDNGRLIMDIDDDGMGFSVENPSELLQRGIRADSRTDGQGIGLAVSTEIIKAAGGDIELSTSPQLGARVRLYFPN